MVKLTEVEDSLQKFVAETVAADMKQCRRLLEFTAVNVSSVPDN